MTKKEEKVLDSAEEKKPTVKEDKPQVKAKTEDTPTENKQEKNSSQDQTDAEATAPTGPSTVPDLKELGHMAKVMFSAVGKSFKAIGNGVKEVIADYKDKRKDVNSGDKD